MKWDKPPVDAAAVKELSQRYGIDLLSAAILVRRGVTRGADLKYYLESDLRYAHSPFLFEDMPDVVERIQQAAREGERVLVFGDRDVDGITSTAVMVDSLRAIGIEAEWRVPQGDEQYGLSMDAVQRFAANDGTLIITVDCGITNIEEIRAAVKLGIDTIVVDHHNPHDELPPAVAIINPKVGDGYPFTGLCACAVAAKVRQALAYGQSDLWHDLVTLINVRPTNDTIVVDAVMLEYGVEVDRISEALVPGVASFSTSRLQEFLVGRKLICYDRPLQEQLLQQGFGPHVEISMLDVADELASIAPGTRGKSLLHLGDNSRLARYQTDGRAEEIDALIALYQTVVDHRFPAIRDALSSVIDLVAIASLADMMPVRDENRILIRDGLERLNTRPWPGIQALASRMDLAKRRLGSREVSWNLTPAINATGRMGNPSISVELLLSDDEAHRHDLTRDIVALNEKRKKSGDDAWKRILPKANEAEQEERPVLVVHDADIERGVTGIIAGRLSRRLNRPAVVLTTTDGTVMGSVRSARGFVATEFLEQFADILDRWGGHNEAAGFQLSAERLSGFWDRVAAVSARVTLDAEQEEELSIDAELPAKYFTPELEDVVRRFEPYGQTSPQLRFLARNVVLEEGNIIGRDQEHLRLLFGAGGYKWPAVYWGAAERFGRDFRPRDRVDIVFEFSRNYFNGHESVQLVVIDAVQSEMQIA